MTVISLTSISALERTVALLPYFMVWLAVCKAAIYKASGARLNQQGSGQCSCIGVAAAASPTDLAVHTIQEPAMMLAGLYGIYNNALPEKHCTHWGIHWVPTHY